MTDGRTRTGQIGYCANVHPGRTLELAIESLQHHAPAVRAATGSDAPLNVGLWFSADAAEKAAQPGTIDEVRRDLAAIGVRPFTFNGFPYGDFHDDRVKTTVYSPSWLDDSRLKYTLQLASLLAALTQDNDHAGVSTVPLGWGFELDAETRGRLRHQFDVLVAELAGIETSTGIVIHVDIEPEPGCVLGSHADLADWFESIIDDVADADLFRRHIRVCHDICHAAVTFEDQHACIARYDELGVAIGKVQVSNAIETHISADSNHAADALAAFNEPRYLHQTARRVEGEVELLTDLPELFERRRMSADQAAGIWRTHFHVPIDLTEIGPLRTTRHEIDVAIELLAHRVQCWEVETYAWSVLPPTMQPTSLAAGIGRELVWLQERMGGELA